MYLSYVCGVDLEYRVRVWVYRVRWGLDNDYYNTMLVVYMMMGLMVLSERDEGMNRVIIGVGDGVTDWIEGWIHNNDIWV